MRLRDVPRFYFHLFNDTDVQDNEGAELPSVDRAVQRAQEYAREMAAESVREGRLILDHRIEVTDELGKNVTTVHFSDVGEIRRSATSR
jgi:hypothetical protein